VQQTADTAAAKSKEAKWTLRRSWSRL
jgi:hypothetical protein